MTTSDTGTISIKTHDGGQMPAHIARPGSGRGPGIVILHEIFGITDYQKRRAQDLANLGYIAVIPDLFWRIESGVSLPEDTQAGLQQAFGYLQKLDEPRAIDDAVAAMEYLRALPETGGRAAVLGFCMGGRLAYGVAAKADPDVVVSYYGSGIGAQLDAADRVTSPILFHFGEADQFLPVDEAEQIRNAFSSHANAEVHMHAGGGHAFDNPSPMFHHPDCAAEAWQQTVEFLQRRFPA